MQKIAVYFVCRTIGQCPHCSQPWDEESCKGWRVVTVEVPAQEPTTGQLDEAAGPQKCGYCGALMSINDFWAE